MEELRDLIKNLSTVMLMLGDLDEIYVEKINNICLEIEKSNQKIDEILEMIEKYKTNYNFVDVYNLKEKVKELK